MELRQGELVLCKFYFSDLQESKLRRVVVFKDNLPFDDFIGIPVSSKIAVMHEDESLIEQAGFLARTLRTVTKPFGLVTVACGNSSLSAAPNDFYFLF